jgi:hypothetical protein
MKIKDVSMALSLFEEAAIKHANATEQGRSLEANKSYYKIVEARNF